MPIPARSVPHILETELCHQLIVIRMGETYIAYPDSPSGRLNHLRSRAIEDLLIGLEFTRRCLPRSIPMRMALVPRSII